MGKRADFTESDNIFVGTDKTLRWNTLNAAETGFENISGFVIEWRLAERYQQTPILEYTGSVVDPTNGLVEVSLAADDTDAFDPKRYVYTLERIDDGSQDVLAWGDFFLLPKVAT